MSRQGFWIRTFYHPIHNYKVYVSWMYAIFMYILPLVMLVLLNTFIYKEVRKMRRLREELSRQIYYL